jgi:hypothetical protein
MFTISLLVREFLFTTKILLSGARFHIKYSVLGTAIRVRERKIICAISYVIKCIYPSARLEEEEQHVALKKSLQMRIRLTQYGRQGSSFCFLPMVRVVPWNHFLVSFCEDLPYCFLPGGGAGAVHHSPAPGTTDGGRQPRPGGDQGSNSEAIFADTNGSDRSTPGTSAKAFFS